MTLWLEWLGCWRRMKQWMLAEDEASIDSLLVVWTDSVVAMCRAAAAAAAGKHRLSRKQLLGCQQSHCTQPVDVITHLCQPPPGCGVGAQPAEPPVLFGGHHLRAAAGSGRLSLHRQPGSTAGNASTLEACNTAAPCAASSGRSIAQAEATTAAQLA